MRERAGVTQR